MYDKIWFCTKLGTKYAENHHLTECFSYCSIEDSSEDTPFEKVDFSVFPKLNFFRILFFRIKIVDNSKRVQEMLVR